MASNADPRFEEKLTINGLRLRQYELAALAVGNDDQTPIMSGLKTILPGLGFDPFNNACTLVLTVQKSLGVAHHRAYPHRTLAVWVYHKSGVLEAKPKIILPDSCSILMFCIFYLSEYRRANGPPHTPDVIREASLLWQTGESEAISQKVSSLLLTIRLFLFCDSNR